MYPFPGSCKNYLRSIVSVLCSKNEVFQSLPSSLLYLARMFYSDIDNATGKARGQIWPDLPKGIYHKRSHPWIESDFS